MSERIEIIREGWEHLPQARDQGVRGFGPTLETAFEQAALGLVALFTNPRKIAREQKVTFVLPAARPDELLKEFLDGVLREMASRQMLFNQFAVQFQDAEFHASMWGEKRDAARHQPAGELQPAEVREAHLVHQGETWQAHAVVCRAVTQPSINPGN